MCDFTTFCNIPLKSTFFESSLEFEKIVNFFDVLTFATASARRRMLHFEKIVEIYQKTFDKVFEIFLESQRQCLLKGGRWSK